MTVYGSWIGSDASVGSFTSEWYAGRPEIAMMVAGYPQKAGMSVDAGNPGEHWKRVRIHVQASAADRFRIRAIDGSKDARGWLGFSEPFAVSEPSATRRYGGEFVLFAIGAALALLAAAASVLSARARTAPS